MTYSVGGLIQATDYNGFASTSGSNINAIWNTAYGQTAVSTVSAGGTVTAAQWSTLNSTLTSLGNHQGTSLTSRANPTAGSTISILSNLGTDITNCNTNKFNAYASGSQYTAWTGTSSKTSATGSGGSSWTITFTHTVTFSSTTAASNFFNAGGLIKLQFSKTSTGALGDPGWNNFITNVCGAVFFSADATTKTIAGTSYQGTKVVGGSGTPTVLATGTGYNQLTGTPVTIYRQFDSSYTYTSNYVQINASVSGSTITFATTWFAATDVKPDANISGGTATTGISFGTAPTTVVTYFPPETVYLTNTWGTPTVAASVA
jgi:hypothetical protein